MLGNIISRAKLLFQGERELRYALHHIMGFWPGDIRHYQLALKHRSIGGKENNERLEFLGDAVLDAVVGDIVFRHFPDAGEGKLTQIRSRIVSRENLGRIADEVGIARIVQQHLLDHTSHNSYLAGNAFEALVGAIYLDKGYRRCMEFTRRRILQHTPAIDDLMKLDDNHKSRLLEWAQKRHITLTFSITQHPDPDPQKSSPIFVATALLNDNPMATGSGYSKKQASQEASRATLELIKTPEGRSRIKIERR